MSHKKRAEDELEKAKGELENMRVFLCSGNSAYALALLESAEGHLKTAADEVRQIDEADAS